MYPPSPPPRFRPEGIFRGRWGGWGAYFEAPAAGSLHGPPLVHAPHTQNGIFRGGEGGVIKFGPPTEPGASRPQRPGRTSGPLSPACLSHIPGRWCLLTRGCSSKSQCDEGVTKWELWVCYAEYR